MSLPTILAAIAVALIISSIVAIAGYYLQTRLRRLEELEEGHVLVEGGPLAPAPPSPPPAAPEAVKEEEIPETKLLEEPPSMVASLVIMAGSQEGRGFSLGRNTLIGRDPVLCDVALSDTLVSRRHARIRQEDNKFYIYDLASANGTFVNGEAIVRAELCDGDRISIGSTELQFKRV